MRFELTDQNNEHISSPSLRVFADTPDEVIKVFKHFRLDSGTGGALALAEAIKAGSFTYETNPLSTKRNWFDVDVYLDRALQPYCALLERLTGWSGGALEVPDMDLTALYPDRLQHTHITDSIETVGGMIHAHVYIQSEDWNGQDAATRAQRMADDYVQENVGQRKHEQQYIRAGNNHIVENKNYMKRHPAMPGIGAEWLWSKLFAWWRENFATGQQRAILAAVDQMETQRYGRSYDVRACAIRSKRLLRVTYHVTYQKRDQGQAAKSMQKSLTWV